MTKNYVIHVKRDKESLRAKQKEVEKMGERHIKEKQRINQVLDIGGEKLLGNCQKKEKQRTSPVLRNCFWAMAVTMVMTDYCNLGVQLRRSVADDAKKTIKLW